MFLVTGGAGFIGSHTASLLSSEGNNVRVIDNLSTGNAKNLSGVDVEFVSGDIRNPTDVRTAMLGCTSVIHLAAKVSVPGSVSDPKGFDEVNVGGFLNVLEAARAEGVSRVVYASSSAVYGSTPDLPKSEEQVPKPESPYAAAKAANELYGAVYSSTMGVECVGLRYFNVFGPRQDPDGPYAAVIPRFVQQCLKGEALTIYGDGEQGRDFISVRDVARANVMAARAQGVGGRVYNIGGGQMRTVNALAEAVLSEVGTGNGILTLPEREGDLRYSVASVARAAEELGWWPEDDFASALSETIRWYKRVFADERLPVTQG